MKATLEAFLQSLQKLSREQLIQKLVQMKENEMNIWQKTDPQEYFTNHFSVAVLGHHNFLMQKEEINAEAFACSYLTELGFDGMEYSISPELFPDLHQAVKNRMNEIMAEAVVAYIMTCFSEKTMVGRSPFATTEGGSTDQVYREQA